MRAAQHRQEKPCAECNAGALEGPILRPLFQVWELAGAERPAPTLRFPMGTLLPDEGRRPQVWHSSEKWRDGAEGLCLRWDEPLEGSQGLGTQQGALWPAWSRC